MTEKQEEEIPDKFWREYESLDMLERKEKISVIVEMIDRLRAIKDKNIRQHALEIALQGYFDDLINYMALSREERKRKSK